MSLRALSEAWNTSTGFPSSVAMLIQGFRTRAFSPTEVVDAVLEAAIASNALIRAFLHIDCDGARAAAKWAERQWDSGAPGALCGVPVSVKDTIEAAGGPTTYGSVLFRSHRTEDAEVVRRLRSVGAVIVGKTNTPEFALSSVTVNRLGPEARNPLDIRRSCGGSSGGAAAATAMGLGSIAIGTDAHGSVRRPAAYTGVVGFKPTYGRIPAVQRWRGAPGRSHIGVLAQTVEDCTIATRLLAGADPRDPASMSLASIDAETRKPGRMTIGCVEPTWGGPREYLAMARAVAVLEGAGHTTVDAVLPQPSPVTPSPRDPRIEWPYAGDQYAALRTLLPNFDDEHRAELTDYVRPVIDHGSQMPAWHYRRVLERDAMVRQLMNELMSTLDILLSVPAPVAPFITGSADAPRGQFELPLGHFNLSGQPAIVVPINDHEEDGLPLTIQLAAGHGRDQFLLGVARIIEESFRPYRGE